MQEPLFLLAPKVTWAGCSKGQYAASGVSLASPPLYVPARQIKKGCILCQARFLLRSCMSKQPLLRKKTLPSSHPALFERLFRRLHKIKVCVREEGTPLTPHLFCCVREKEGLALQGKFADFLLGRWANPPVDKSLGFILLCFGAVFGVNHHNTVLI